MLPEDPKINMAKILFLVFAFIIVFVGNTSGIFSSTPKEQKQLTAISLNLFNN